MGFSLIIVLPLIVIETIKEGNFVHLQMNYFIYRRQFNIIRCSTNAMKGICNGTLANELDEIFQETSSILKCVKK